MNTAPAKRVFKIRINEASGLRSTGFLYKPDPFVVIGIDAHTLMETRPVRSTCNPRWEEEFMLPIGLGETLTIQVFDNKKKHKKSGFLGVLNLYYNSFFVEHDFSAFQRFKFKLDDCAAVTGITGMIGLSFIEPSAATENLRGLHVTGQTTLPVGDPLPSGWEERTSESGRTYFIDHNTGSLTWEDPRLRVNVTVNTNDGPQNESVLLRAFGETPPGWERRIDTERRVYYVNHEKKLRTRNVGLLEVKDKSKKMEGLLRMKEAYLRAQIEEKKSKQKTEIKVRRHFMVDDMYAAFYQYGAQALKGTVTFKILGEEGLDFGGVSNEILTIVSQKIFGADYGLFEQLDEKSPIMHISNFAGKDKDTLSHYYFSGEVLGYALITGKMINVSLSPLIYKHLVGESLGIEDMKVVFPEVYSSLIWIRENDVTDLGMSFVTTMNTLGVVNEITLKTNGQDIEVTENNKTEYISLIMEWYLTKCTDVQMQCIRTGMLSLVNQNYLNVFNGEELEKLLTGENVIDVEDWKQNTAYDGSLKDSDIIEWFWEYVESLSVEQQRNLLLYSIGTTRIPCGGFRELRGSDGKRQFTIVVDLDAKEGSLPKAQTCFNRLIIPFYSSYEMLVEKFNYALKETSGFQLE
eukprot:GHVP01026768.1.p1 GENE.GHVP01026768.1~~GHVP01026768.1.p1  ORF type:complete len:633 (+),score=112.38 GHVP01026768.1:174-2072(+)